MPSLNPEISLYLIGKHPGTRRAGLESMWACAWSWVEDQVSAEYLTPGCIPATFESAAILRVQAICTSNDPMTKQSLMYAAAELLAPYAR